MADLNCIDKQEKTARIYKNHNRGHSPRTHLLGSSYMYSHHACFHHIRRYLVLADALSRSHRVQPAVQDRRRRHRPRLIHALDRPSAVGVWVGPASV